MSVNKAERKKKGGKEARRKKGEKGREGKGRKEGKIYLNVMLL